MSARQLAVLVGILACMVIASSAQTKILIPMDLDQPDHLKAYGIAYWSLKNGVEVDWLLNYRGGSFMIDYTDLLASECRIRGVGFAPLDASSASGPYAKVQR